MNILHKYIALIIISMLPLFGYAEEADRPTPALPVKEGNFEFGLQYDGELQTNFHGDYNFLNLLRLDGSVRLSENLRINVSTLSIAHTNENLASDLQTFSNLVTDENVPLTIAVAGMEWEKETAKGTHKVFLGVRNTGEDYFASEVTSFFVNSSNGIFPTISANYPICTYPYASMSLHYEYDSKHWGAKATVYNGEGHYRLAGRDNVFRICPKSDGVFVMAQGEYKTSKSNIFLGGSLYKDSPTLWTYAEHNIGEYENGGLSIIATYSHCFEKEALCRNFVGAGAKLDINKVELGIFSDYADYSFGHEYATELSCRIPLCKHLSVKPSLHYINGTTEKGLFGLVRMTIGL